MDEYSFEELIAFAQTALGNRQYKAASDYYRKALEKKPDDLTALSRAGSLCVVLGEYDEAFVYFNRAVELDPKNGDNYFNLGNAYYFTKEYAKCLDLYTKAELIGCSPEVTRKLLFQKGMLCSARGDARSALTYLNRYEDACAAENAGAIDPRVLAEKVRLHLVLEEYEKAQISAAKLLNVQPNRLENYLLYYTLMMKLKKYDKAEQALFDAEAYAELKGKEHYLLGIQKASYYIGLIDEFGNDAEIRDKCEKIAGAVLDGLLASDDPEIDRNEVKLKKADMYIKLKRYAEAVEILKKFLPAETIVHCETDAAPVGEYTMLSEQLEKEDERPSNNDERPSDEDERPSDEDERPSDEDERPSDDERPDNDEERPDDGDDEEEDEEDDGEGDEDGDDPGMEAEKEDGAEETEAEQPEVSDPVSDDFLERVRYFLMSCYVSLEDYSSALRMSGYLTDSANDYYRYFSRYCEAYAIRFLAQTTGERTAEEAERKYAEVIAFYRSQMMKDPKDKFAVILRTRMYAEQGAYFKAEEMTRLLSGAERDSLTQYIAQCRSAADKS